MNKSSDMAAALLREAADLVAGPRADDYGDFLKNSERAAALANITPLQAADAMIGYKNARLIHTPDHHDSIVDKIAYTALREVVRLRTLP